MPTFAGAYIREPSDFSTVATETTLIQVADDPSVPVVPSDSSAWADLSVGEAAALVNTINPIVIRKEGIVNGFLRAGGYAVPADVVLNPVILDYAVRLVWNDLRYRKQQLTDEEYGDANKGTLIALGLIASGGVVLDAPPIEGASAPTGAVHAASSATRVFSRDTLDGCF